MPTRKEFETIDAIVDEVVEDEAKAQELKRALHRADAGKDPKKARKAEISTEEEDGEELWDDVPV